MKNKIGLITILSILPACVIQGLPPSDNQTAIPTVTVSNPGVSSTPSASAIVSKTPIPTTTPTIKPTNSPTENTNLNRKITFNSTKEGLGDIYVINSDGSGRINLTNVGNDNSRAVSFPVITPDGAQVIYSEFSGWFKVNVDGSNKTKISDIKFSAQNYNWSKDGKKLILNNGLKQGIEQKGTFIYDLQNNNLKKLDINCSGTDFSPDNNKFICSLDENPLDGTTNLFIFDIDGNQLGKFGKALFDFSNPKWVPDGSKIIFNSGSYNKAGIYSANPDGENLTKLVEADRSTNFIFKVSPDGSKVAYTSEGNLFRMNIDGSDITKLSTAASFESPSWSPDNNKIAFMDGGELYVINVNGSNKVKLTTDSILSGSQPNGVSQINW